MKGRLRNEASLQRAAIALLESRGAFGENRSPGPFGRTGVPDWIGVYRGRYVAIEFKHPRERGPGEDNARWKQQRTFLKRVAACGGFAAGINNLQGVYDLLAEIDTRIQLKDPSGFYGESFMEYLHEDHD